MIPRPNLFSLLATLALLGCQGQLAETCSADGECAGELYCAGPDDPQVCGIPPRELCERDADCDPSSRCHAIPDGCSPDGVGAECLPPCRPGGCFDGFRCNDDGACEAVLCDAGYTCPAHQRCAPPAADAELPAHARTHGCVDIACRGDGDCPADGACVDGLCHSGPGFCAEEMLVP